MKKFLLALALLVLPSLAHAQCNGVFANNTVCGNITGSSNLPRPTNPSAFLGAAGGLNGQIQYNTGGALGGLTNTEVTARINAFTSVLSGAVPLSGGGVLNFLRADGTFANPNIVSASTITGASTTYTAAQNTVLISRSNAGAAMSDVLPGTGPGVLPSGTIIHVTNVDTTGILSIKPGAGAAFTTVAASTGFIYLCPGQTATFYSNGTNYATLTRPDRCVFRANTTIFIATTGSATNDGLTVSTPLLDPSFAYNLAKNNFDLSGNIITFQLATGTYSKIFLVGPLLGLSITRASANVIFLGNAGTPANVILSDLAGAGGEGSASIGMQAGAIAMFNGFQLSSIFNNNMNVNGAGTIAFVQNLDFHVTGAGQLQVVSTNGADFVIVGNYTISTGGGCHWIAGQSGAVETFFPDGVSTITITLTGTPAFTSGFACVQYPSTLVMTTPLAFSGGATGKRYFGTFNGIINTGSGNPNFFPGNAAGTLTTGAQYN